MGRQIDIINNNKEQIAIWHKEQKATDWISRQLNVSRGALKKIFPDYKGNQGGKGRHLPKVVIYDSNSKICMCGAIIPYKQRYNKYCSSSCFAKFNNRVRDKLPPRTEAQRTKQSLITKELWNKGVLKISNQPSFNSKGEKELRKSLQSLFPENNWTTGALGYKGIQRDIFSEQLKIAIEYDGIWHFKDIKGQLRKKLRKDVYFEKWCIKHGWILVRIDEITFLEDKALAFNRICTIIKNNKAGVYKLWDNKSLNWLKESVNDRWFKFLTKNVIYHIYPFRL